MLIKLLSVVRARTRTLSPPVGLLTTVPGVENCLQSTNLLPSWSPVKVFQSILGLLKSPTVITCLLFTIIFHGTLSCHVLPFALEVCVLHQNMAISTSICYISVQRRKALHLACLL